MEAQDLDAFGEISLNSGDSYSSGDLNLKIPSKSRYRPSPKRLLPPLKPIDFATYVREMCQNKIKILQPETFHQIQKPIVIFFNHFREKCVYHTKCLDKLYQLSVKYEGQIEFIAGDIMDIDVMNSKWYPIDKFCSIQSPEKVSSLIFAIDAGKRIYQLDNGDKTVENLLSLCESLLKGELFKSQPLTQTNNSHSVKICVSNNYQELVIKSTKYILLIIDLEDYGVSNQEDSPNYELVAQTLVDSNVDVVYLNAEKNYVPFELNITNYPSLLLFDAQDKTNFMDPLIGSYNEENIINCVKAFIKDPEKFFCEKQKELRKSCYQPLPITPDFNLDFADLKQYLETHCDDFLKVFDRSSFMRSNRYVIIAFMDFKNKKCSSQHLKWIDEIYQVACKLTSPREYYIADYQDIDVINNEWKPHDFIDHNRQKPNIFGIDLNKNKFILKDFKSPASLYYFAYSLTNGELYISEAWPQMNNDELVKTCIADSLNLSINNSRKDIFLIIYYSNSDSESEELLKILESIAIEMKKYPLKLMKIDARLNCISLELDNTMYPIMYYIPQVNKNKRILYPRDNIDKQDIVEFLIKNINENKVVE